MVNGLNPNWRLPEKSISSLCSMLNRGPASVFINSFEISAKQFQTIVSACTSCKKIRFNDCKIGTENLRFRTSFAQDIRALSFYACGHSERSNWDEYPERIYNLLKAIAQSGLKQKLQIFDFHKANIAVQDMIDWIIELGLERLKVIYYEKRKKHILHLSE
ncbi:unnamed protein product [Moneuplotes crassus]|uniref:Uncharacterized protein n=1 Tax=Euplotes crassus TaxID=5936 RepID=A0AAD1XBS0_EUPCR|nr:unnamed protein product [Moneuplotes crassus]